jgi:hypothetical protein
MHKFIRENGLTLVLSGMFLVSVVGMIIAGHAAFDAELKSHGFAEISLASYVSSGQFLSALFENWESEFLQMAAYVVLTAMLFQRGSSESRDPDDPDRPGDDLSWESEHPALAWLYSHSLGLTLALLFLTSFALHWWFSMVAANENAVMHGSEPQTAVGYLLDPQLWFESFQNWQSEFLSTAVLVVLSIFLRHQGSPESKPVAAPHRQTGE